jgi:hypothetical protein
MDQHRLAGLGNLLTDEILWRAKLDPARPASSLTPAEHRRLHTHVRRTVRSDRFTVTVNRDFDAVMAGCADPQTGRPRTWINARIRILYRKLYDRHHCHSIEVYEGDNLVGGLYGVTLGRAFFGESMFHRARDASKLPGKSSPRWVPRVGPAPPGFAGHGAPARHGRARDRRGGHRVLSTTAPARGASSDRGPADFRGYRWLHGNRPGT